MRSAVIAVLALGVAGCAGMGRMMSYGSDWADAKVTVGTREFAIWVHDADRTLLINRNNGAAMGQGMMEGLTFGGVNGNLPAPIWRAAANGVLSTMGCRAVDVYTLDNSVSWEATYECPDGVDPRQLVADRRDAWRQGIAVADPLQSGARP